MGRTILITGCSSGIGRATAQLAAGRGHRVIATAPTERLLEQVPASAALRAVLDVTDPASVEAAVQRASRELGPIDCAVNNAGFAQVGPVELVDDERLRAQLEVNLLGALRVVRAVVPSMRERGSGRIVSLGSLMGRVTVPFMGAYCVSKHALRAATDALRLELDRSGIQVVLIEPGWIRTGFMQAGNDRLDEAWGAPGEPYAEALTAYRASADAADAGWLARVLAGTPEQVAGTVVRAAEAERPRARYPVTAMARVVPWLHTWVPTPLWDAAQRRSLHA